MRSLALLVGVIVVIAGLTGLIYPSVLVSLADSSVTPPMLYAAAVLRIGIGLLLLRVSRTSRMPGLMRGIGIFVIIAGVATALMGTDRASAVVAWWVARGPIFIRVRATGAVVAMIGGAVIYAIKPVVSELDAGGLWKAK